MDREQGTFRIKLTKDGVKVVSTDEEPKNIEQTVNVLCSEMDNFTLRKQCFQEFDELFDSFLSEILTVCDKQKQIDSSFVLISKLIKNVHKMEMELLREQVSRPEVEKIEPILNKCFEYVNKRISCHKTNKLRLREYRKNPMFVEPEEHVIGMRWKTKIAANQNIPDHKLVQTTYQFVSPLKTIKSIFSIPNFEREYFEYNAGNQTNEPGIFESFCSGSVYKNSEFFQQNPNALQIELAIDDFESCCGMKSKATVHKITGIYFRLRNIPPHWNSKVKNINLVALCETSHLKVDNLSTNDILERFVQEIKELETLGIELCSGKQLKGIFDIIIYIYQSYQK